MEVRMVGIKEKNRINGLFGMKCQLVCVEGSQKGVNTIYHDSKLILCKLSKVLVLQASMTFIAM